MFSIKPIFEDAIDCVPMLDVIMNPGDIVYIPMNHWHQGISHTKRLSISFPMAESSHDQTTYFEDRNWIKI